MSTLAMPQHESLTENGFTVAEEARILRILQDVRSGKAKTYSDEEVWKRLGLDDEPPLTEDELEQLAIAKDEIARGEVITWEELKRELAELP